MGLNKQACGAMQESEDVILFGYFGARDIQATLRVLGPFRAILNNAEKNVQC